MNLDKVFSQVFVGSHPESVGDIDRLQRDFGVTAVLNLHTQEDIEDLNLPWETLREHYRTSNIELRRVPVRDFDREDLRTNLKGCVDVLRLLLDDGHTVYVHCTAGVGRSPSVVIAYLHWVEKWNLDRAIEQVTTRRGCSPDVVAIQTADRLN